MMTPKGCLETSETDYPVTRHHIPGGGITQLHRCRNPKTVIARICLEKVYMKKKKRTYIRCSEVIISRIEVKSVTFREVSCCHTYRYTKVRFWRHEPLTYRKELFKTIFFLESLWSRTHGNSIYFYRLLLKNRFNKKNALQLIVLPHAETKVSCRISWTSRSLRLRQCCRLKRYVSYSHLLTIRWSPKEITQHRALVNTNVNVY